MSLQTAAASSYRATVTTCRTTKASPSMTATKRKEMVTSRRSAPAMKSWKVTRPRHSPSATTTKMVWLCLGCMESQKSWMKPTTPRHRGPRHTSPTVRYIRAGRRGYKWPQNDGVQPSHLKSATPRRQYTPNGRRSDGHFPCHTCTEARRWVCDRATVRRQYFGKQQS